MIQGSKKKSCPAIPELFTIDFCYKISNNNLRENNYTNTQNVETDGCSTPQRMWSGIRLG